MGGLRNAPAVRIGEFSDLTGIAARTLRHYDRRGYLVPARVDDASGYRGYGEEQVQPARVLAALVGSGTAPAEAARIVAERDVRAARARAAELERVVSAVLTWTGPAAGGGPVGPARGIEVHALPPRLVVELEIRCTRHQVVESVRAVRARLADICGTTTTRLPRAARCGCPPGTPVPDGPVVLVHDPSHVGRQLHLTVQLPWRPHTEPPVAEGLVVRQVPGEGLVTVCIEQLARASLSDVVTAHQVLDDFGVVQGRRLQLYDRGLTRLWVGASPLARVTTRCGPLADLARSG